MLDFRKMFVLLAAVVMFSAVASAQLNPLSCVANAASTPLVRAEGVAEEVGQVVITCQGGTPKLVGQQIDTINVQIFLNVNLTSRLVVSSTDPRSEALLLMDEPGSVANPTQLSCTAPNGCPMVAVDSTGSIANYNGSAGRFNIFHAVNAGQNSVAWLGVPFNPPGTQQNRVMRLVNVRANASELPGTDLIPAAIQMRISITGTGAPSLSNPVQTVAFVRPGLRVTFTAATLRQCAIPSSAAVVRINEGFANAFRTVGQADQNVPGTIYNTETMFTPQQPPFSLNNAGSPAATGLATQGTRIEIRLNNIPANLGVTLPNPTISGTNGEVLTLVGASTGVGATSSTRSATVIYEVTTSNVTAISEFNVLFTFTVATGTLPALGDGTVAVNFSPISSTNLQAFWASDGTRVPRFVDRAENTTALSVVPCRTNLLWPYVTTFTGFETGLAISNTSQDPFGTRTQQGTCLVSYYGSAPAGVTLPNRIATANVAPGTTIAWTVSQGAGAVPGVANFTGYVIAECNFQFGHGYGFITNIGDTRWAQGYLALVLDGDMHNIAGAGSRTGFTSETLKH